MGEEGGEIHGSTASAARTWARPLERDEAVVLQEAGCVATVHDAISTHYPDAVSPTLDDERRTPRANACGGARSCARRWSFSRSIPGASRHG
jgi:hypothetical protein